MTLGYTLELVPLLVKAAAINRLLAATKKMKRVRISVRSLYFTVASLFSVVVIFMLVWTIVDKPERSEGRYLTDDSEIVKTVYCSSEKSAWSLVVLSWNGLLIVCATVLAFQSRTIKQEFNDSQSLGTMIYSHFVFGVLRAIVFNLEGTNDEGYPTIEPSTIAASSSLLLSFDVITAVTIYILPKLAAARKAPNPHIMGSDFSVNPSTVHPSTAGIGTVTGSRRQTSTGKSPASGFQRSIASMPSIDEGLEEHSESENSSSAHRSTNVGLRINMDGSTEPVKEAEVEEDTSSSDGLDNEGPRFVQASPSSSIQ